MVNKDNNNSFPDPISESQSYIFEKNLHFLCLIIHY